MRYRELFIFLLGLTVKFEVPGNTSPKSYLPLVLIVRNVALSNETCHARPTLVSHQNGFIYFSNTMEHTCFIYVSKISIHSCVSNYIRTSLDCYVLINKWTKTGVFLIHSHDALRIHLRSVLQLTTTKTLVKELDKRLISQPSANIGC